MHLQQNYIWSVVMEDEVAIPETKTFQLPMGIIEKRTDAPHGTRATGWQVFQGTIMTFDLRSALTWLLESTVFIRTIIGCCG